MPPQVVFIEPAIFVGSGLDHVPRSVALFLRAPQLFCSALTWMLRNVCAWMAQQPESGATREGLVLMHGAVLESHRRGTKRNGILHVLQVWKEGSSGLEALASDTLAACYLHGLGKVTLPLWVSLSLPRQQDRSRILHSSQVCRPGRR